MIKSTELREGNLLYDCVKNIGSVVIGLGKFELATRQRGFVSIEECAPIPLTPEILEKAGFESKAHPTFIGDGNKCLNEYISDKNKVGLRFIESNVGVLYCNIRIKNKIGVQDICCEMKYLHQLQNLYFALTGTELEIEL